jgi:hypothetical protein
MTIATLSRRVLAASLLALPATAFAAPTLNPTTVTPVGLTSGTYSQDFDTLANTGTSSVLPTGWQIFEGGANGNAFYTAGNGSTNAGTAYSYGATGSTDRALGTFTSGNLSPIYLSAFFTNNLGSAITGLSFAYTGEQWRVGNGEDDRLTFQYSLDATAADNGTWTSLSDLDFAPLVLGAAAQLDGNLDANRRALSGSLAGLSIATGSGFAIRWVDTDVSGNDIGFGVDDFRLTATAQAAAVPEPASWAMMIGGFAVTGLSLRRRRAVRAIAA